MSLAALWTNLQLIIVAVISATLTAFVTQWLSNKKERNQTVWTMRLAKISELEEIAGYLLDMVNHNNNILSSLEEQRDAVSQHYERLLIISGSLKRYTEFDRYIFRFKHEVRSYLSCLRDLIEDNKGETVPDLFIVETGTQRRIRILDSLDNASERIYNSFYPMIEACQKIVEQENKSRKQLAKYNRFIEAYEAKRTANVKPAFIVRRKPLHQGIHPITESNGKKKTTHLKWKQINGWTIGVNE